MLYGDKHLRSVSQDLTNNLGAAIRIIPNRDPGDSGYTPVSDNPFFGHASNSEDIIGYGFRNPWTGIVDSTNRLLVADVGAGKYEEIDIINLSDLSMMPNFGWPTLEGPCEEECDGFVDPVLGWTHASTDPYVTESPETIASSYRTIYIGLEYTPISEDRYNGLLTNAILVGDFMTGWVRAIVLLASNELAQDIYLGNLLFATGWDQGPDDYIYATTYSSWFSTEGSNSFFRMELVD